MVSVAYQAQLQVKGLTPRERSELDLVLAEGENPKHTRRVEGSSKFVSSFGDNLRVLWEKSDSGDVTVLAVVEAQPPYLMELNRISLDLKAANAELSSFRAWMSQREYFAEKDVVVEIAARPNMASLLGFTIRMPAPDLFKFEFGIKGLFRADFVVGNDKSRKFLLVEFEDGQHNSLFAGGTKQYRHWSPRLEHGFGQVVDWAWAKHSHPADAVFTNAFGGRVIEDSYIVICGRAPERGSLEEQRFDFRRSRVQLSGVQVQFQTYDDMVNAMTDNIRILLDR